MFILNQTSPNSDRSNILGQTVNLIFHPTFALIMEWPEMFEDTSILYKENDYDGNIHTWEYAVGDWGFYVFVE